MKNYIAKLIQKIKKQDFDVLNISKVLMGYGVSFVSTKAKIPISIGLILIDIINTKKDKDKEKRDVAIEILKNYDKIPKISKIETSYLNAEINLETSEITGLITKGVYADIELKDLKDDDINKIIKTCNNEDTIYFLKKYQKL